MGKWLALALSLVLTTLVFASTQLRFKETASAPGILQTRIGRRNTVAPVAGTVQEIFVDLGAAVSRGDKLATISTTIYTSAGDPSHSSRIERLESRQQLLMEQKAIQRARHHKQRQKLLHELDVIKQQRSLLQSETTLLTEQLELSLESEDALQSLLAQKAISRLQFYQARNERLEQQRQLQRARVAVTEHGLDIERNAAMLEELELESRLADLHFEDELATLTAEIDTLTNQQSLAVLSELDGKVSEILAYPGTAVNAGQTILMVNTADKPMVAYIYAPSSIAVRIQEGQRVMLRYDAFDYQNFGRYPATVSKIGRARLDPRETLLPVKVHEPVYLIEAIIKQQSVSGPETYLLKPETQFIADFVMGEMTLLQFVLRPMRQLRDKVQWKPLLQN